MSGMFGRRQVEVLVLLVLLVWMGKGVVADDGREQSPVEQLNQTNAEITLSIQTTLRRHFIESLANLHDKIPASNPFLPILNGILQGLRSRSFDPLQSFVNGYHINSTHSPAYRMATVIYSMQGFISGCTSQQTTLADWHSFLQAIPDINATVPPPPSYLHPLPHRLHVTDTPYVLLVLIAIHRHRLLPNRQLLGDILYNFPFNNHSPDLDAALANFIHMLHNSELLLDTFRPSSASVKTPNDILSDILKFVLRQQQSNTGLDFQAVQLLSALSDGENVGRLGASTSWELLELVRRDDYPPDIVTAAVEVAAALRRKQVNVDESRLKGYPQQEKLLGLISQLSALPSGDPLSGKVHAIFPHVKLRYLSNKGQFFRPRTASDVAFLLNSFLTIPNPLLIGEVRKIFLLPYFDWRTILGKFDYSKYSKPRSLVMDMLQELLRNSDKLPACDLILLTYFLRNNSKAPDCTTREVADDVLIEKLARRTTPLSGYPHIQELSHPTAASTRTFATETTELQCSDGPPVDLIDRRSTFAAEDIRERQAGDQQMSTGPAVATVIQKQLPQEVPTASSFLQSIIPSTTASSALPVSVSTAARSSESATLSQTFADDAVTTPFWSSSFHPPETTSSLLPTITTASPTVGPVDTTPGSSATSTSSFSDTTYTVSFFPAPSQASSGAPTAVPAVLSRFLQITPPSPSLSRLAPFTTSHLSPSPASTARPSAPPDSNSPLSRPTTASRLSFDTALLLSFSTPDVSSQPFPPSHSKWSHVKPQDTSPAAGAITWMPTGGETVLPTQETESIPDEERREN